jgi:hypothetical protein
LTLPRRSSTREFRDALKTKYADSHLKGIAPDTLKIFAPGVDSPFEFDHIIGELSESKNDPLIVMVPPPVWFQLVGADSLPFKGSLYVSRAAHRLLNFAMLSRPKTLTFFP